MPLFLQSKLLRVLGQVRGARGRRQADSAGYAGNLQYEPESGRGSAAGAFSKRSEYRINTVEIKVPPLRQRMEDIAPLCEHIIAQVNEENGVFVTGIQQQALRAGRIPVGREMYRELEHVLR